MLITRRRAVQITVAPLVATVRSEEVPGPVTLQMAKFVVRTKYDDLPRELIELGKKSILDGVGLALVGSVAKSGAILRQYLESQGLSRGSSTVVGSAMKAPPRFAAFANGVGIHADDYDDTQLAVAPDR